MRTVTYEPIGGTSFPAVECALAFLLGFFLSFLVFTALKFAWRKIAGGDLQ